MNAEKRGADTVTLKIPRPLYDNLQTIIQGTGFRSVTEFAIYVLRDLASSGSIEGMDPHTPPLHRPVRPSPAVPVAPVAESGDGNLSPEEVELVRRRLRSLGYL